MEESSPAHRTKTFGLAVASRRFAAQKRSDLSLPVNGRAHRSGGDIEEAIPDPISNSEVKLFGADGTARIPVWESRTLPG